VQAIVCDIRDRDAVHAAVETIIERFGRIDVLVNNAGVIQMGPVRHMAYEDFQRAMDVHYWGALHMTLAALPHLRPGARIVNIASIGGKYPLPHLVPYCARKFALVGLSESLRAELLREGIHVTTVSPGLMRTGSPPNITVKGDHEKEYGWFVLLDSLPLVSIGATRAARKIIDAARHGDPSLTITPQAKLAIALEGIAPGCVARLNALANALLPKPAGAEGNQPRTGFESRPAWLPDVAVRLTDRAGVKNNEV
jgi:NAD(P)-dependent dehydrogenase (short-subunit alcohol dehydrogenase family)